MAEEFTYTLKVDGLNTLKEIQENNAKLLKQREQINFRTEEGQQQLKKINEQLENNKKAQQELTSATKSTTEETKKTASAVKSTTEGAKGLKNGIDSWTTALKASGIIVLIDLIVQAFMKVKDLLMSNGDAAAAIGKIMAGVNAVIQFLVDNVVKLFKELFTGTGWVKTLSNKFNELKDKIIDAFSSPKKFITALWDFIKSQFVNRFNGMIEQFKGLVKLFSGDFKEAFKQIANGAAQMATGIKDPLTGAFNAIEDAANSAIEKAKEAAAIEEGFRKITRASADLNVEIAKNKSEYSQLKKISEDTTKSIEERINAVIAADKIERKTLDERLKLKQEELDLIIRQNKQKASLTDEEYTKQREVEAELYNMKAESTEKSIELQNKLNSLRDEQKRKEEEALKAMKDEAALLTKLPENYDTATKASDDYFSGLINSALDTATQEVEIYGEKVNQEKLLEEERVKNNEEANKQILLNSINMVEELQTQMFDTFDSINELSKSFSDEKIANIEKEMAMEGISAERKKELEDQKNRILKEQANREKVLNISRAIMDGAVGIIKTGANVGYPAAIPLQILQGIQTAAQIALIARQKFATGGLVIGSGTGTSDSIPAMLSNGEVVINSKSASMFRNQLSDINVAGGGVRFATGGIAGSTNSITPDISNIQETIIKSIRAIPVVVSESDITTAQRKVQVVQSNSIL